MSNYPQLKTSAENMRQWLFDGLMSQIEPDLTSQNRSQTIAKLKKLSSEGLEEQLLAYKQALLEFTDRWPKYVDTVVHDMNAETKTIKRGIAAGDSKAMAALEQELSDLT